MDKMIEKLGMGWLPDYPDFRDYTAEQDKVSSSLKLLGQKDSVKVMLEKAGVAKKTKVGAAKTAKVSLPRLCVWAPSAIVWGVSMEMIRPSLNIAEWPSCSVLWPICWTLAPSASMVCRLHMMCRLHMQYFGSRDEVKTMSPSGR